MIFKNSLTWRLNLFYIVAVTLSLITLSTFLWYELVTCFLKEEVIILNSRADKIKEIFSNTHFNKDFDTLKKFEKTLEGVTIRINKPDDKTVIYTSDKIYFPENLINDEIKYYTNYDLEKNITYYNIKGVKKTPYMDNNLFEWRDKSSYYRGMRIFLTVDHLDSLPILVTIGINIDHHRYFLHDFTGTLSIFTTKFILIATVISALLHWFLTNQGLQPLQILIKKATLVSGKDIQQRMPVENIPSEISVLSETLNNMLSRLDYSFRRLENFSSDIAHELRTPINNLMMQTQVSISQPRTKEEYLTTLVSNAEEFERLSKMIYDMLFLAKTDDKSNVLFIEEISLDEEVFNLFEFYEILAQERNVTLSVSGKAKLRGDRNMLNRAIGNLISNAIRHCFEGSIVNIYISRRKSKLYVYVCNDGPTIAKEDLPYLFDRFYRIGSERTHERVGLGLAITRSIAKAHGGDVSVSSGNQLTTFLLTLDLGECGQNEGSRACNLNEVSAYDPHH
ncbi:heavy metal sensor histidine kinase [Vibrio sp. DW001]|uniref:heavy metal sensor histidine kinase n=1 Tax=Vibrio sp. DW001 TaxID=2912315 RepID=UPI0023AF1ECA|nr:heavy metal sensor histidine kinase [Vibrio sp. DW001]WED25214.1 heavy metal sensor histidine kinase [Vibrio sp. DW001]